MTRYKFARASVGVVILVLGLVGCPEWMPKINLSPTAFDFSAAHSSDQLILSNSGTGTLEWNIVSFPTWLTVSPVSGTITNASQVVSLQANSAGLASGTHQGEIIIESTGGTRAIAVSITVVPGPTLDVSPTALDFGSSATSRSFRVTNVGSGTLTWSILTPLPNFYSVNTSSGSLTAGAFVNVTVTFDRDEAEAGTHTGPISITSNGGSASVTVTASVQALLVTPTTLDFGSQLDTLPLTIANAGAEDLHWIINPATIPAWLTLDPAATSGTLTTGTQTLIMATADRTTLPPGTSTGEISITSESGAETVFVSVEGYDPTLLITPVTLDLGSADTQGSFTIQNTGTGPMQWTAEEGTGAVGAWTPQDIAWLTIASASTGTTTPGTGATLTVQVDRSAVTTTSETPFVGNILVASADGEQIVLTVQMLALPPTLRVIPADLNFATTYVERKLALWNGGLGTVNWRIDTTGKPAWLTITPVDGAGIASGSVAGDQTDMVTATVNRSGLPPAARDYTWTFDVTAQDGGGTPLDPVTITVTMNVAPQAAISVDTGENNEGIPNVDEGGTPFIPFGTALTTNTFDILNQGTGNLQWSIDVTSLPAWVTSISPSQGVLEPLTSVTVTVTVDRSSLDYGEESYTFPIVSNDPTTPSLDVRIELQVPKRVVIGVKPTEIAFGLYGISDSFEVANLGDPDSVLNFQVSTNKPWLFIYPETGTSQGTAEPIKDWRAVNVSIDRAQLDGTGATATITVTAFETDQYGVRVLREDVAPVEITVSVEAAELSFEAAQAKTRIPSLVRLVLLMRNLAYQPIPLAWDTLDDYVNGFAIFEDDVAVEESESGKFLTSAQNLRTDAVILLDYSGSMYAAAQGVSDPAISGAPDPLQALYELAVPTLIDELPANYNIALMEFHERSQPSRVITAPDGGPAFTRDKNILKARLEALAVLDHGATELLPAVLDATLLIEDRSADLFRIPFDDADFKTVICVTDGRLTTPPGTVRDVSDYMQLAGVRFLGVGWGAGILHEPLARLASGTGGHYYPTRTETTGATGPGGQPVVRAIVSELVDWCTTDPPAVAPCDQSISKDLASQVVFSYVTLTEDTPVAMRISSTFDDPNDDEGLCLADQGLISGSLTQKELDFLAIAGDVRLGQISLHSDGIQGGEARVIVRAEYIPRNVDSFEFQITSAESFSVSKVSPIDGGIVDDWTLTDLGGNRYSLTRPAGVDMLSYGAFGDMLNLDFTGVGPGTFTVDFDVLDPVYTGLNPYEKYFTAAERITVGSGESLAPAFPTPEVRIVSPPTDGYVVDFGSGINTAQVELRNIGGNHVPTGVWLNWYTGDTASFITVTPVPSEGILDSPDDVAALTLTMDRTIERGLHAGHVVFEFNNNTLATPSVVMEVVTYVHILPPVLSVTPTTLDFGDATTNLSMALTNTGQSTVHWGINAITLPTWLEIQVTSGSIPCTQPLPSNIGVEVRRAGLAAGTYTHTFTIESDAGNQPITVTMIVP